MSSPALTKNLPANVLRKPSILEDELTIHPLNPEDGVEVITFLSARPVETIFMAGLIYDNGLVSSMNRGAFYGCRNAEGRLIGVALIGHATLFETENEAAL